MATETSRGIPLVDENDGDKAEGVNTALREVDAQLTAIEQQNGDDKASLNEDNLFDGVQTFHRAAIQHVQGINAAPLAVNHDCDSGFAPIIRIGDSQDSSAHAMTGLTGGVGGLMKLVWNVSGGILSFLSDDARSIDANRFRLSSPQIDIPSQGFAHFVYDNLSARWRLISKS